MAQMIYGPNEPLSEDYKELIRGLKTIFEYDALHLRRLRDSPTFTPSVYWPTRRHVHAAMREKEATIEVFKAELQCEYAGDAHWERAQRWAKEVERWFDAFKRLDGYCYRPLLPRPLTKWCNEDQWGTSRECSRGGSGGHHHGGTVRGRRRR